METKISIITAVQGEDLGLLQQILAGDQVTQSDLNTGLCWSARQGHCQITRVLLTMGADPNSEVWGGFSPLLWAAIFGQDSTILKILIDAGSSVNCASHHRHQTPLHATVIRGNHEFAEYLLKSGADPDLQDYLSRTPLHYAMQRNHTNCMKLLIKHNCDVNVCGFVNGEYFSPLYHALVLSNLEAAKLLLIAGAKFNRPSMYCTLTIKHFYQMVEDGLNLQLRPVYLQQQCRVCVRHQFGNDIIEKLEELVFPRKLKDFLLLEELDNCYTCG